MTSIPQLAQTLQTVLTTAVVAADAECQYTQRPDRATFTASTLVQTLVWGWLAHPDARLDQLAQMASAVGAPVSAQAIDQRFTMRTAQLLQAVLAACLQQAIAADPVVIPILQRFSHVLVQDSTTIALPNALAETWRGCGGTADSAQAALKCGVQFDLLTGQLRHLDLADGRSSDQRLPMQHARPPVGSLRLADLGFVDRQVFADLAAAECCWLSRVDATTRVGDATHPTQPLTTFLTARKVTDPWEGTVTLGTEHPLTARMLVLAVPATVAAQRRRRIRQQAKRKGETPSAAALANAAWTVLITNVPADRLSLAEAMTLIRARWQIELLFKLWKSHGQVARWRSQKPARILCEVYAKLIAMVLQHWLLIVSCWGEQARSLVKAARAIRTAVPLLALALALDHRDMLTQALQLICTMLTRTARIDTRANHPNTYQQLGSLTHSEG